MHVALGTPGSYETFITGLTPNDIVGQLDWSSGTWNRMLCARSEANITSSISSLYKKKGLIPRCWENGLRVERDGRLVWWGPIRRIQRPTGTESVSISAFDAMGLTSKRPLVIRDQSKGELLDMDVASVFGWLVTSAGDLRGLVPPRFTTDVVATRFYKEADYELVSDAISELNRLAMWTVVNHELIGVGTSGVSGNRGRLVFGPFDGASCRETPGWVQDGDEQANGIIIPAASSGEEGVDRVWIGSTDSSETGELWKVITSSYYRPTADDNIDWDKFFTSMISQMLSAWAEAPLVVSNLVLSPKAPISVDDIIPGTFWTLDVENDPNLVGTFQLESVEVDFSANDQGGLEETVAATMIPPTEIGLTG